MHLFVAFCTQCDQVLSLVTTHLAAELKMVHLQVLHRPADLAAPSITLQNPAVQSPVTPRVEANSFRFREILSHDTGAHNPETNAACCALGRKA